MYEGTELVYNHLLQDEEWEDADEDEDEDDEDEEGDAGAMDVKLNKEPSSVFKELSGYEHLLTEEVHIFLFV